MKGEPKSCEMTLQPLPQTIISVRDKNGRNNALDVGYVANVSHDPAMVMVGIEPIRFSQNG